jgi:hypothetical protein
MLSSRKRRSADNGWQQRTFHPSKRTGTVMVADPLERSIVDPDAIIEAASSISS